jgi:hypothetical protein
MARHGMAQHGRAEARHGTARRKGVAPPRSAYCWHHMRAEQRAWQRWLLHTPIRCTAAAPLLHRCCVCITDGARVHSRPCCCACVRHPLCVAYVRHPLCVADRPQGFTMPMLLLYGELDPWVVPQRVSESESAHSRVVAHTRTRKHAHARTLAHARTHAHARTRS